MCNQRNAILPALFATPPNDGRFSTALSASFMDHPLRTLIRELFVEPVLRRFGIGPPARLDIVPARTCDNTAPMAAAPTLPMYRFDE
jgi:hypothetical protein